MWEKTIDIPYNNKNNQDCELASREWEVIVDGLSALLMKEQAYAIYTLGKLFLAIGKPEIAKKKFDTLLSEFYSDKYTGRGLLGLANYYRGEGNYEEILGPAEKALAIAIKLNDIYGIITAYVHLGYYYRRVEKYSEALDNYKIMLEEIEARDITEAIKQQLMADYHFGKGLVYKDKQNIQLSLQNFDSSLKYAVKLGDEEMISQILFNKGTVKFLSYNKTENEEDLEEGLDCFNHSLAKARSLGRPMLIVDNLIYISLAKDPITKKKFLEEAMTFAKNINPRYKDAVQQLLDNL